MPFTLQRYVGDAPALIAVAVNVASVPLQILGDAVVIPTVGVKLGFTVIVMEKDEFTDVVVRQLAFDVSTAETTSPFTKLELEKVLDEEAVPVFVPFTFHCMLGLLPPLV